MTALALLAAFTLGVIATARATRLVVHDAWPPAEWVRDKWVDWTGEHAPAWALLLTCPFCAAPWIFGVVEGVAIAGDVWQPDLTTVGGWWWTLAVWAAGSYLASMVVLRDEPAEE